MDNKTEDPATQAAIDEAARQQAEIEERDRKRLERAQQARDAANPPQPSREEVEQEIVRVTEMIDNLIEQRNRLRRMVASPPDMAAVSPHG